MSHLVLIEHIGEKESWKNSKIIKSEKFTPETAFLGFQKFHSRSPTLSLFSTIIYTISVRVQFKIKIVSYLHKVQRMIPTMKWLKAQAFDSTLPLLPGGLYPYEKILRKMTQIK